MVELLILLHYMVAYNISFVFIQNKRDVQKANFMMHNLSIVIVLCVLMYFYFMNGLLLGIVSIIITIILGLMLEPLYKLYLTTDNGFLIIVIMIAIKNLIGL